jgi:hypothetical protein
MPANTPSSRPGMAFVLSCDSRPFQIFPNLVVLMVTTPALAGRGVGWEELVAHAVDGAEQRYWAPGGTLGEAPVPERCVSRWHAVACHRPPELPK